MGLASGATYIPGVAVISHYFQRRRALAIGVATSVRLLFFDTQFDQELF